MLTINTNDIFYKAELFIDEQLKDTRSVISKAKNDIDNFDISELGRTEQKVIKHIQKDFKRFLLQTPIEHQRFINSWKKTKPKMFYDEKIAGNDKTTLFGKAIKKALRYTDFRAEKCVEYSKIIGIKTCPYCNAMLVINISDEKARYQLDHFYPKSRYPYLSISFFNLIPSCNNCNHIKRDKDVTLDNNFHLYSDKPAQEIFKFSLDRVNIIRNLIGIKENDLKVNFTYTDKKYEEFVKNHDNIFHIQKIYDTQNDIAHEMLWKTQAYNKTNIKELGTLLHISENEVKRMIVGNYTDFHEIHKRPLSKYMQDIAKDLELI